ncbi:hypothetical protein FisN_10Lu420 [Fistulifera solaris]|uniref:Uncharacterized protein n=1 Tax=Fistulifera solaris TaxID=1519565 RepID=A0A1Z5JVC8_FISSO|nr:hypothetical protein FisN_10Lu420 [Fistulifera solaris]|eukprot:GAX17701.1 hypothetical protein FisN_10Lu420 [Fistulifera solaris]
MTPPPQRTTENHPLLELIPLNELTLPQQAFTNASGLSLYRFLQEPTHLQEFDGMKLLGIGRPNDTVLRLGESSIQNSDIPGKRVYLTIDPHSPSERKCVIYGTTDAAIAETMTFFASLKDDARTSQLVTESYPKEDEPHLRFDFTVLQPEQLARILDANPRRRYRLQTGVWNSTLSVVLATCPYPLQLTLVSTQGEWGDFCFQDEGTRFVQALQERQTPFGSLELTFVKDGMPLSPANLEQLLQLENCLNKLSLSSLEKELAILPFTAKVQALEYVVNACDLPSTAFDGLIIPAKDLELRMFVKPEDNDWGSLAVSFFHRLAELGHLEQLTFSVEDRNWQVRELARDAAARVAEALVGAIGANPRLKFLNIGGTSYCLDWDPYMKLLFRALETHPGMRTLLIRNYPKFEDPYYEWLWKLLNCNRRITVHNAFGFLITDNCCLDRLYALNRFYCGSANLVEEESIESRSCLVAMALAGSALGNFRYTALLLLNHTDVLCGF